MFRIAPAALLAATAVSIGACGGSSTASTPSPAAVKARVERAAAVKLTAAPIAKQARDEGLIASFSNQPTAVKDHQVVFVFMTRTADIARKVKGEVRNLVPGAGRMIVRNNVLVLYANDGNDHGPQVEKAVEAL